MCHKTDTYPAIGVISARAAPLRKPRWLSFVRPDPLVLTGNAENDYCFKDFPLFYMTGGKEIWYERKGSGDKKQPTGRLTAIAHQ